MNIFLFDGRVHVLPENSFNMYEHLSKPKYDRPNGCDKAVTISN